MKSISPMVLASVVIAALFAPMPICAVEFEDTSTGHVGSRSGEGNGATIIAPGLPRAPVIDGLVDPQEWEGSLVLNIADPALLPVEMYLRHNGRMLFVGIVDTNDTELSWEDEIGLYFEDEGGTPPMLYDNTWNAATCPSGEGNFFLGNHFSASPDQYRGFIAGPGACPIQQGETNVEIAFSVQNGAMHYEAAIDLVNSQLRAAPGDTFGWRVFSWDNFLWGITGMWPMYSSPEDPTSYGNLTLGELLVANPVAVMMWNGYNADLDYNYMITTLAGMGFNPVAVANIHEASSVGAPVLIDWSGGLVLDPAQAQQWVDSGRGYVQIGDWPQYFEVGWEGKLPTPTPVTVTVNNSFHPIMQGLAPSWSGHGYWYYGWADGAYSYTDGSLGEVDLANLAAPGFTARDFGISALDRGPGRGGRAVHVGLNVYGPAAGGNELTLLGNTIAWLTEGLLFLDGFEVGTTLRWEDTVP